ncbi:MAG: hypothetical protein WCB15_24210, partial [Desulfobacterales bacterium]
MKKALILSISFIAFICYALFTGVADASAKTIDLKFATGFSPKHTMQTKVFEPWAKKISEMTNG